jgi:hypothetical protein
MKKKPQKTWYIIHVKMESKREVVAGVAVDVGLFKTFNIILTGWKSTPIRIQVVQIKIAIHTIQNTLSSAPHVIFQREEKEEGVEVANHTRLKSSDHTRPQVKPKSNGTKKQPNIMQSIGLSHRNTTNRDKLIKTKFNRKTSREIRIQGIEQNQTKIETIMIVVVESQLLTNKITVVETKTTTEAIRIIRDQITVDKGDRTEDKDNEMFRMMIILMKICLTWDIISHSLTQLTAKEM